MIEKSNNLDVLKPHFFNGFIDTLENKDIKKLFKKIKDFHPSEIAAYLQILNDDHREKLIKFLEKDFNIRILVELEQSFLEKIINDFNFKIIKKAISQLDSDEVANLIEVLDPDKKRNLLSEIPKKDRLFIESNLSYKENTAGRLMQKEVVKIPLDYDVGNTIDFLRKSNSLPKVFYDVFIIDTNDKFIGTVPLSTIISTIRKKKIFTLMKKI